MEWLQACYKPIRFKDLRFQPAEMLLKENEPLFKTYLLSSFSPREYLLGSEISQKKKQFGTSHSIISYNVLHFQEQC